MLVHWYQPLYLPVPICYWYCTGTALVLLFICTGTVGTVGTLVPATLCLCTNMLLVLHWYCYLSVLVLWVLLVHWYRPFYVSVPICYWYCTGTALVLHWYCTGTALVLLFICTGTVGTVGTLVPATLCLYQYVTCTALVLLFICTGTVGTVGKLVPATQCLCAYMLLVLHWYCTGTAVRMYWYCGYCWYTGTSHSMSMCLYVTGTALVLLFICIGTVGTVGT